MGLEHEQSTMSDVDPPREIRRTYTIIEDWLGGIRDTLTPYTNSLAADFTYVTPNGTRHDRRGALDVMTEARGVHAESTPPLSIEIRDIEIRSPSRGVYLVTYEEFRRVGGEWRGRTSSALLGETTETLTGLRWLHLQETAIDDRRDDNEDDEADDDRE